MTTFKYFTAVLIAIVLTACANTHTDDVRTTTDDIIYQPQYASGFEIIKCPDDSNSVIINIFNPWQGAKDVTESLLIDRSEDKKLTAPQKDMQILRGNAQRIIVMSSTAVAMLDAIGHTDAIVGVSGREYISSPTLNAHMDSIKEIGFEGNIDYEAIYAARPDIVIVYGVNGPSSMKSKLADMKIPMLYLGDYIEESPLGKSEWMIVLGELTGDRKSAEQKFNEIVPRYTALAKKVKSTVQDRPKVMFNLPYNDAWYMPGSKSYQIRLIEDAGGQYIYNDASADASSSVIDIETALMLSSGADVWLNTGSVQSMTDFKAAVPRMTDVKAVRTGMVFNNTARLSTTGGNDYYESGVVNPDIVLRDLVKILHPDLVSDSLVYYKQLK